MEFIRAYPYPAKIVAQLDYEPSWFTGEWRRMYSRPITVFYGVDNPIRITFLNADQKAANLTNITANVNVFSPGTQYQWITKPVTIANATAGQANITFTSSDLAPLELGFYEIGMTANYGNSNATPVFLNDNYLGRITMDLQLGPVSSELDPIPVSFTDTSGIGVVSDQIDLTVRPTGDTTATFCANLVQPYTGNIIAQGTMVTNPTNNDFGNIIVENYSNVSGNVMFNVLGSYATIRFIVDAIDPWGNSNVIVSDYIDCGKIRY